MITAATSQPSQPPSVVPMLESFECGKSSLVADDVARSVGYWTPVNDGELPWQVYITDANSEAPICGGTLISPRHVLTSGQCSKGVTASNRKVVVGKIKAQSGNPQLNVTFIYKHPHFSTNYGHSFYEWDFSILLLSECVEFTSSVQP